MTTQHLIDAAHVDGPALEQLRNEQRIADLEASERMGRELLVAMGEV